MDTTRIADGLHQHTAGFAAAVENADPDQNVPTCPEWPLRVLTGHIGQAHRWAASIVRDGPSPVPDPFDADPGSPEKWSDWLREGAQDLEDAVTAAGDAPVWTFFGPQPARFWLRRMLHDTTIHHADAALTAGRGWLIARNPDGVRWTRETGTADVTLAGPVRDLLLVLTRRLPAERVTVTGDEALAAHWLAHTAA
ncbi:maleylpyruvate isomerase family mycothiol-dependent enzyme [Amycolatopsis sp. NPDC024027]|uniref:maleylpyruvate isomerase N-terminal domain-containing protein n=1 Tax=Amycolatopsis sp. NPDC024027 TaxID=3154327 RepID=UPI0033EB2C33